MSSIANLPYGKILDYWYENLKGHKDRNKFLITKLVEAFAFRSPAYAIKEKAVFVDFPKGRKHELPIKPTIGIVIPIYTRTKKDLSDVQNLINSILRLSYPPDMVIVVDDCSPLAYELPASFIKVKLERNSGPAKARNKGIELALEKEIDVIAFTDADCILDVDWTKQIIFHFQQCAACGLVSGNTVSFDQHWFGEYHNINGTLNGRKFKDSDRLLYGTTANLAITSEVAREIRFNETFPDASGEDIEFCFRANRAGFEIKFNKKLIVHHHYGYTNNLFQSLKKFRFQFKKYGKGERILLEQVPEYYAYFEKTEEIKVG
ncbi:MAG: glycosyltransferase [Bacteroidota bacterium]